MRHVDDYLIAIWVAKNKVIHAFPDRTGLSLCGKITLKPPLWKLSLNSQNGMNESRRSTGLEEHSYCEICCTLAKKHGSHVEKP